jgi:hypothetical protein
MPRDSTGKYTLPAGNPVVTQTLISSSWANTTLSDVAAALTDSLSLSLGGTITGPISVPAPTTATNPTTKTYVDNAVALKVAKAGDAMTGALTMNSQAGLVFNGGRIAMQTAAAALNGYIAGDATYGVGFINTPQTQWTFHVTDAGNASVQGSLAVGGVATCAGQLEILAIPGSVGQLKLQNVSGITMTNRAGAADGVEWVNNAYTAVIASLRDSGNFAVSGTLQAGSATYFANGDINGGPSGAWGANGYLSNVVASKSPTNTQIPWAAGPTQMSSGNAYNLGSPWVMCGLAGPGNGTLNAIGVVACWLKTP